VKPEISQRELAKDLGFSLGKANFCNSQNILANMYLMTP
jgi:hypothetical protein